MGNQKQNTRQHIASALRNKVMKNSHNTGRVFSNWDTKCICEQQRGASTQTSASPCMVRFCHCWLELACQKSQEAFIVLITHWNAPLHALPVSE